MGDYISYNADVKQTIPLETMVYLTGSESDAVPNLDIVNNAIDDAESRVKSRLGVNYTLPLDSDVTVSNFIKSLSIRILLYVLYLWKRGAIPEDIKDDYADAMDTLEKLANGEITAGFDTTDEETVTAGTTVQFERA
jgi:phage gp36-like protein